MIQSADFDPNILFKPVPYEFRIYADDNAQTWGVVDEEDWQFLVQWRWSWSGLSSNHKSSQKQYLRRNIQTLIEPQSGTYLDPVDGYIKPNRKRIQQSLRMHVVIMLRTEIPPPDPDHLLVDHRDGNEHNYRRKNLRWYTHSKNTRNRFGSHADVAHD